MRGANVQSGVVINEGIYTQFSIDKISGSFILSALPQAQVDLLIAYSLGPKCVCACVCVCVWGGGGGATKLKNCGS